MKRHLNFIKVPGHINAVCVASIYLDEGFFIIFRWQFELSDLLIILKAAGSYSGMSGLGMIKPPSFTSRKLL